VLRSTDAEVLAPVIGIEGLLTAPNVAAFDREVQKIDLMMFNFVFADDQGAIGSPRHRCRSDPRRGRRRLSAPGTGRWQRRLDRLHPERPHARHDQSGARLGRHCQPRHHAPRATRGTTPTMWRRTTVTRRIGQVLGSAQADDGG
jgi:hypothetical protein